MVALILTLLLFALPASAGNDLNTANQSEGYGIQLVRHTANSSPQPMFIDLIHHADEWKMDTGGSCSHSGNDYTGTQDANGLPEQFVALGADCLYLRLWDDTHATNPKVQGQYVLRMRGNLTPTVSGAGASLAATHAGDEYRATFDVTTAANDYLYLDFDYTVTCDTNVGQCSAGNTGCCSDDDSGCNVGQHDECLEFEYLAVYPPGGVCTANDTAPFDLEPWGYCDNARCSGGNCPNAAASCLNSPYTTCTDLEYVGEGSEMYWHPLWLSLWRGARAFRWMNALHTNDSLTTSLAGMRNQNVYTWAYDSSAAFPGSERNIPLLALCKLANLLNQEPWVNIPHQFSDAERDNMIRFVRDTCPGHLLDTYEYSNEVWNGDFDQAQYALDNAAAEGISTGGLTDDEIQSEFMGLKTHELGNAAESIYDETFSRKADTLLQVMLAGRTSSTAEFEDMALCANGPYSGTGCFGANVDGFAGNFYVNVDCPPTPDTAAQVSTEMTAALAASWSLATGRWETLLNHDPGSGVLMTGKIAEVYEGGPEHADDGAPSAGCLAFASDALAGTNTTNILQRWRDHFLINGDDVRRFMYFNANSIYEAGTGLFGSSGVIEGTSGPKYNSLIVSPGCDWLGGSPACDVPTP